MDETYSITDARAKLPELIRVLTETGNDIGITQQGRLTAVLTTPKSPRPVATSWLHLGTKPADTLPDPVSQAYKWTSSDAGISVWTHVASGALITLAPSARWDEVGRPVAYYFDLRRWNSPNELPWGFTGWNSSSSQYEHTMDVARTIVEDMIRDIQ